jgi:hypothetical protein
MPDESFFEQNDVSLHIEKPKKRPLIHGTKTPEIIYTGGENTEFL